MNSATDTATSPAAHSALIVADRISKSYMRGTERLQVLDALSIQIEEGEFVALMGPSGSGKTTLLNLIAGFDTADAGSLIVAGSNLSSLSENELSKWRLNHVGFVFQFYNLLPVLSAQENVALPLMLFGMSAKERNERARFSLEVVGLGDRVKHLPSELSGGQEQRVAIARAIVTDPKLIVADEPTGDLDRASAEEVLALLKRLNTEFKKTIVMVTHDPAAASHASRIVRLDKGKLVG
ncbi:MAG: ABC transporter ATP-binding protein [Deltaproteobacteria bacterium]|nr:ABC transporter ATP-binding protein [Deltaproteobacteria bacterium]